MKKMVLIVLLLFSSCLLKVNAYTFPDSIDISGTGGVTVNGFPMTTIKGKINSGERNVFCTRWGLDNPSQYNNDECTLATWPNVNNEKASAAIGSIILYWRQYSNSYFYTTVAINRFLYEINPQKNKLNKIAPSVYTLNTVKDSVDKAKEIYNNYGNDNFIKVSSLKLNGTSIKNNDTVEISDDSKKYIISATIECYDKEGGNKISCDLPGVDSLKVDNITNNYNDLIEKVNTEKNADESIIKFDVTSFINSSDNSDIVISFYNQREYLIAQNYDCGYNKQTISPNYILTSPGPKITQDINFKIKSGKEKSCEDRIGLPEENILLYNEQKKEGLLDTLNPSCDNVDFKSNASCEKTVSTNQFVKKLLVNGSEELALCKTNITFNNLVANNKNVSKNSLLYMPDDMPDGKKSNLFGQATVEYDCDIPAKYKKTDGATDIIVSGVNELIPNLKLKFKNNYGINDTNLIGVLNSDSIIGCKVSDNNIICPSYTEFSKYGVKFTAKIDYTYSDNNKYAMSSDGSLKHWTSGDEVYGYGVLVPSTASITDGEMTIEFSRKGINGNDTILSIDTTDNSSINAVCNFQIKPEDYKNEIIYRTIDINNPFNNPDGTERLTGSNWCSVPNDGNINIEDTISSFEQYRVGDVNMDGVVDNKDVNYLSNYLAEKTNYPLDINDENIKRLADVERDGVINSLDIIAIQALEAEFKYATQQISNDDGVVRIPNNSKYCQGNKEKNDTIEKYIYLRPNANGKINLEDGSTKSSKPVYKFVLDANNIKKIREYNKENASYSGSDGEKSSFVSRIGEDNYANVEDSLCDIKERCDISEVINKQFSLGG